MRKPGDVVRYIRRWNPEIITIVITDWFEDYYMFQGHDVNAPGDIYEWYKDGIVEDQAEEIVMY